MHILILHPVATWYLIRLANACAKHGWKISIITVHDSQVGVSCPSLCHWIRVDALTDDPSALMASIGDLVFDAVVPGNEFAVIAADLLAAELGVYHNDTNKIIRSRNKREMRRAFLEANIPQPKVIASVASVQATDEIAWAHVKFPVIVKPVDMAMSLFVKKCDSKREVDETLSAMFKLRKSRLTNYEFSQEALIEEFVDGPEFSLECIVSDFKCVAGYLTKKYVSTFPACYEVGYISGKQMPLENRERMENIVSTIAQSWGMSEGVMHLEFKMAGEKISIIEGAARPCGDHLPEVVEQKYGISLELAFILARLGRRTSSPPLGRVADGFFGIRFDFPERSPALISPEIKVITIFSDASQVVSDAEKFSMNRRSGYVIASSPEFEPISKFVGAL